MNNKKEIQFIRVNQHSGLIPVERIFYCRYCGDKVEVNNIKDRRTVYCSSFCEKDYWRFVTKISKNNSRKKKGRI